MSGYYKPFSFRFRSNPDSFIFSLRISRQRPTWDTPVSPLLSNIAIFLLYFSLIAAAQSSWLFEGVYGDDGAYVNRGVEEFSRHPLIPYVGISGLGWIDSGHPLLYAWFAGLQWALFGMSNWIIYVNLWLYGAWSLFVTHQLSRTMAKRAFGDGAPRWAGLAAGMCLYSLPYFISHTHQFVAAIPHLALCVTLVWLWAAQRRGWLTLTLCLMPLFRIDGAFFVLGLGLFDFLYSFLALKYRRFKPLAIVMLPYIISAACLGVYFHVKLVVLDLPISTIGPNKPKLISSLDPSLTQVSEMLALNVRFFRGYLFHPMNYSMELWIFAVAVGSGGLTVRLLQRWRRKNRISEASADASPVVSGPGYFAMAAAYLAMLTPPALFFLLNGHLLLYRRFIPFQVLLMILGIHALIYLFYRARYVPILLIAGWCLLMGIRWHEAWIGEVFQGNTRARDSLASIFIDQSQDLHHRKRILHDLADWVTEDRVATRYIGAYFTMGMIQFPCNGYIMEEMQGAGPHYIVVNELVEEVIESYRRDNLSIVLLNSSFDSPVERAATESILESMSGFGLEKVFTNPIGDVIEVYRYRTEAEMVAGGGE